MVTSADPNRGIMLSGSARKSQNASFTSTWLNVTGSGPPFRTLKTNSYSVGKDTRWTLKSSAGGRSLRSTPAPLSTIRASNTPRPRSGRSPKSIQPGPRPSRFIPLLLNVEEAHPAELGELAYVGMEYEPPGEVVAKLHDPPFSLGEHLRVGELRGLALGACRVVVKEVGVRVKAVYEVELQYVDYVGADQLPLFYLYGVLLVVEGHRVYGVDLILGVEVGVEAVHDHDHLVGLFASLLRVYDERPIEPLLYVLPQGRGVAVVEVHSEGLGAELVGELLTRAHELEDAVHVCWVEAVEVDRVRVLTVVLEHHPQPVPLGGPQGRPRYLPVIGPSRVHNTRCHLNLDLLRRNLVLPDRSPALPALLSPVEVPQEPGWVELGGVHAPRSLVASVRTVLGPRRANVPGSILLLSANPTHGSPQERAGNTQGPCGSQEVATRKTTLLNLAHTRSSHAIQS